MASSCSYIRGATHNPSAHFGRSTRRAVLHQAFGEEVFPGFAMAPVGLDYYCVNRSKSGTEA
eukprot:scaffold8453_cov131-Amphora_coffeaeformis.AAC.4